MRCYAAPPSVPCFLVLISFQNNAASRARADVDSRSQQCVRGGLVSRSLTLMRPGTCQPEEALVPMAQVVHLKCHGCSRANESVIAAVGGSDCVCCSRQVHPNGRARRARRRHAGGGNIAASGGCQGAYGKQFLRWQAGRRRRSIAAAQRVRVKVFCEHSGCHTSCDTNVYQAAPLVCWAFCTLHGEGA